jgi:AraC family transcriptional regulator of adaptative response / methylphosphotriester-DNA alkyltransferase methyltransferase
VSVHTLPVTRPNLPSRPRAATLERRRALFDEAIQVIEREYRRGITLDETARRLATSRRQLQRVLQEVGGTNFRELVLRVRMRDARHALGDSELSVRDIARAVGYSEAADFGKAFRRYHGISPSRYRERLGSAPEG